MVITFVHDRQGRPKDRAKPADESTLQIIQQPLRARSTASEDGQRPSTSSLSSVVSQNVNEEHQGLPSPTPALNEGVSSSHTAALHLEPLLPATSLQRILTPPAAHGQPLRFVDILDSGSLSATLHSPLPTGFTPTNWPEPHYDIDRSGSCIADTDFDSQDRYEIDLLTYFRYEIAPRLDLELGESYFGDRIMHRANHNIALYQSILALSTCQRAATKPSHHKRAIDDSTSSYVHARQCMLLADGEDRLSGTLLLTLRDMAMCPPRLWQGKFSSLQKSMTTPFEQMLEGQWQLMSRLALASRLMARSTSSSSSTAVDLSFVLQGTCPILPGQYLTHKQQLRQAIANLARALLISSHDAQNSHLPLTATWLSCWSDNQLWFSARNEEMRQIFEVQELDVLQHGRPSSLDFPVIVFSNVCALLANFVHHLAALHLLHHKPRLIKAFAESGSSISSVWHAQRLVGMIAAFDVSEVFDPLVVAGLVYAAKRLSHPSQLTVVVNLLKKASQWTGLELQEEIDNVEETLRQTGSW